MTKHKYINTDIIILLFSTKNHNLRNKIFLCYSIFNIFSDDTFILKQTSNISLQSEIVGYFHYYDHDEKLFHHTRIQYPLFYLLS